MKDGTLEVDQIFDTEAWNRQLRDDLRPLLKAAFDESIEMISEEAGMDATPDEEKAEEYLDEQVKRAQKANESTREEVAAALLTAMALREEDDDARSSLLKAALVAIFANLIGKRRRIMAEHETQTAMNAGTYFGSRAVGLPTKTWKTRKDARVRQAHALLDNKTVGILDGFAAGDSVLRFPGDPLAPPHLTINCRCVLRFRR